MTFRHPLNENSGRGADTPDRPTHKEAPLRTADPTLPEILEAADDGHLVDMAMYRAMRGRGAAPVDEDSPIDAEALAFAERRIADFAQKVGEAETILASIGGFVWGNPLGDAAVGRAGIKLGEAREQYLTLLEVVRDLEARS